MIGYVKGKLISDIEGEIILENNGVGFSITPSAEAYKEIIKNGGGAVYTYMAVREDDISLYGFKSMEEKKIGIIKEELKAAGLDEYVAEYQRQFSEFMANK